MDMRVWGHDGCSSLYRANLTSCPRHPGTQLKETTLPKITRFGGHTNAGLTDTDAGFADDTVATQARADQLAGPEVDPDDIEAQRLADASEDTTADVVDPPFDPAELTVADVNDLLAGDDLSDEQRDAVLAAERAGKNRAGIVGKPEQD